MRGLPVHLTGIDQREQSREHNEGLARELGVDATFVAALDRRAPTRPTSARRRPRAARLRHRHRRRARAGDRVGDAVDPGRAVLPPRHRGPAAYGAHARAVRHAHPARHPPRALRRHPHRRPARLAAAAPGLPRRRRCSSSAASTRRATPCSAPSAPARRSTGGSAREEYDELVTTWGVRPRLGELLDAVACVAGPRSSPRRSRSVSRPRRRRTARRRRCSPSATPRSSRRARWSSRAACSSPPTTPATPAGSSSSTGPGATVGRHALVDEPDPTPRPSPRADAGYVWVGDIGDNLAQPPARHDHPGPRRPGRPHGTAHVVPAHLPRRGDQRRDPAARPPHRPALRRHQERLRRHAVRRTPAPGRDRPTGSRRSAGCCRSPPTGRSSPTAGTWSSATTPPRPSTPGRRCSPGGLLRPARPAPGRGHRASAPDGTLYLSSEGLRSPVLETDAAAPDPAGDDAPGPAAGPSSASRRRRPLGPSDHLGTHGRGRARRLAVGAGGLLALGAVRRARPRAAAARASRRRRSFGVRGRPALLISLTDMARLRRSSPDDPGWTPAPGGHGFVYLDEVGHAPAGRRRRAGQGPGHPARVARRVGLPLAERSPPGRRHRRRRPAAVPLPPRLAHPAGRRQARAGGGVRTGAVEGSRAGAGRPRHRGHEPGPRLRRRRPPPRPRLLPDRQRRVRRGERQLRAHHAAAPARAQAGPDHGLLLRRQVGDRALHHHRRPGHRRGARGDASPPRPGRRGAARVEGAAAAGTTSTRPTSTTTSAVRRGSRRPPRTSAPGTRPCSPPPRWPSQPSPATPRRRANGRRSRR